MAPWDSIKKHINFYRIHIIVFTFLPIAFTLIFYASNGSNQINFVDSLFVCVSAMMVCGLSTVELSLLTPWQQVLLFIQMCIGNPIFVSWLIVLIRKYYFANQFNHLIASHVAKKADETALGAATIGGKSNWSAGNIFRRRPTQSQMSEEVLDDESQRRKLRPDMIRRVNDILPKLVNPSGWISETAPVPQTPPPQNIPTNVATEPTAKSSTIIPSKKLPRRLSDPGITSRPPSPVTLLRYDTTSVPGLQLHHVQTVEFASDALRRRGRPQRQHTLERIGTIDRLRPDPSHGVARGISEERRSTYQSGAPLTRHATNHSTHQPLPSMERDFGGFPMPHEIIGRLIRNFFPSVYSRLSRSITVPVTTTIMSHHESSSDGAKLVSYLKFDAVVSRNSAFRYLTNEQLEELGGVEYRALNVLLWIVAGYHIGIQILGFVIVAPYISTQRWSSILAPPQQHSILAGPWFALFQVVSAYTNTGMSLVDQSMVPFQRAYIMILALFFLVLAGNTAFPVFLRFVIWIMYKLVPEESRSAETLQFLLDHPRRCFIYLFPSHQTWFLLTIVLGLTFTDWFFFIVLDVNNPEMNSIPLGVRCIVGLMQAVAVRAAGFGSVALATLAPAVKFLFVVMMYVSVFPIAMSVRTTNVYEEQSLGVYPEDEDDESETEFTPVGSRAQVWGQYLAMHVRKQLAFDMWWIVLAIFIVCIIEQRNIDDPEKYGWFNIFNIIFELVSAYGTVGLSLGAPGTNASFSAVFHPLSKLIVCAVMIRGRHRGLPVAIDRAVLFPSEFKSPSIPDPGHTNFNPSSANVNVDPAGGVGGSIVADVDLQLDVADRVDTRASSRHSGRSTRSRTTPIQP